MPQRTCTEDGCDRPHLARGLCGTHYNRVHCPPETRYPVEQVPCSWCGTVLTKRVDKSRPRRYCGYECRSAHRAATPDYQRNPPRQKKPSVQLPLPFDKRSNLRRAYEEQDWPAVIAAVYACVTVTDGGCWEWQRRLSDGYAVARMGKRDIGVHRLIVEATHGQSLGDQPVHHKCANARCVAPDHLQPVTHRENLAEMLARRYMERRIKALEAALTLAVPDHALLSEIGIA